MSLYNMVFGVNPHARALLDMLKIKPEAVPRLRDCFIGDDDRIVIMTRTGGGNRKYFDNAGNRTEGAVNDDLRASLYFAFDHDCKFDNTFALFHFSVPSGHAEMFQWCKLHGGKMDPEKRWEDFKKSMASGEKNPQIDRAMKGVQNMLKGTGILDKQ